MTGVQTCALPICRDVDPPDAELDHVGDGPKGAVADEVAVPVIDRLELVHVHHQEAEAAAGAGAPRDLALDGEVLAKELGAQAVELHTGQYALAGTPDRHTERQKLQTAAAKIRELGLGLHAGHGLNYHNVHPIACIPEMHELNIGHTIVSRAVLVGMERAVREMKQTIYESLIHHRL